jgi:uncharacterized membrane protein
LRRSPGVVRVSVPWINSDALLTSAFEQIRLYSKTDITVSLRRTRALDDIVGTVGDPGYRLDLHEFGMRLVDGCAEELADEEVRYVIAWSRSELINGCSNALGLTQN